MSLKNREVFILILLLKIEKETESILPNKKGCFVFRNSLFFYKII